MNDKIIAIKIKDGDQYIEIPITALAQNVYWDSTLDLNLKQHIIGEIDNVLDDNDNIIPLQEQIDNLNINKADIDSPTFTGTPKIEINNEEQDIATENYVDLKTENQLKTSDLKTTTPSSLSSSSFTSAADRQYPVIFDSNGKLSVNVPWENTEFSSSIENVWTGRCSVASNVTEKEINLDNPNSDNPLELNGNEILAIYFENGNTANNPKISINNTVYSIGFLNQNGTIEFLTNNSPFYNFSSGLKFFVYKKNYDGQDNNCWLLFTIDYSTVLHLNNNKADINSPIFTGTPKIRNSNSNEDQDIATQRYVDSKTVNQLTTINLIEAGRNFNTPQMANISQMSNRQYPVTKNIDGYLSVNVPWVNSSGNVDNIQNLFSGFCNSLISENEKQIIIDNDANISSLVQNIIEIGEQAKEVFQEKSSIIIYFKYGNDTPSPIIKINGTTSEKDILYQSGPNTYSKIEDNISYYQWGPGLKIFTYVKYTENNEQKDGWVISSFDGLIIKNLNDRLSNVEENKANINSPIFTGVPAIEKNSSQSPIATVEYVQSEDSKILNSDNNYAIQLKPNGGNNNIFTVDWNGNVNGIDLSCFHTEEIMKSNPKSTIIGKYNAIVKNVIGLFCGTDIFCSNNLMVGESVLPYDSGAYAFVIGNGEDNESRFNIFGVDWNGNVIVKRKNGITLGSPSNTTKYYNNIQLQDTNNNLYGIITSTHYPDDMIGFGMCTRRTVNGTNINNEFKMQITPNGDPIVYLSYPYAWQKGLSIDSLYSGSKNPTYQTITFNSLLCAGCLTSNSKQIQFFIPHNVVSTSAIIQNLSIIVRGGAGQQYLYQASGSNNNTYTQLGNQLVVIWENSKTKRTNGVESISCNVRRASGFNVAVTFKNTLRKSASTTVAQNNMPVSIVMTATIKLS